MEICWKLRLCQFIKILLLTKELVIISEVTKVKLYGYNFLQICQQYIKIYNLSYIF